MAQSALASGAEYLLLNEENSGAWRYAPGSFLHPIALDVAGDTAYLLDGGRVLALNLAEGTLPELLLSPGDRIEGVPVIEPLDLALVEDGLLVLERAGDVYRYDLERQVWTLERYERPIGETSSHYYVALADRVLVEPSYNFALQFGPQRDDRFWLLPQGTRPIDVGTLDGRTYTLVQTEETLTTTVHLYQDATELDGFRPTVAITRPRQLVATDTAVYILDQGGERLLELNPKTGELRRVIQPPPVSAFWTDGERLILAGREQLYFVNEPERWQTIAGGPLFEGIAPHDPAVWSTLGPFLVPVSGWRSDARELQMPGAPRHYRLGIHEGIDFYWGAGTPVWAVAGGVVIRATHEYELPDEEAYGRRHEEIKERGYSTADEIDFYRGMQVWVEHADGTVARYAHLSEIEEEVVVGTAVTAGQLIGKIGNSGSPAAVVSPTEDAHLHLELWFNGHYLGQFLRPVEVRELVGLLFDE
jgi:murein DD-endopeptidase MepM/ murein hydrolase activator NlpD